MNRFWKIAGIATLVAILGATAIGTVALAQDAETGADWPFDFREKLHEAIAGALGISVETYDAAVEAAREEVLGEAVTEGWLTEEQAERMRERADPGRGPGGMKGFRGPRGGRLGGPENSLIGVAAETLDMSVQDLVAELRDGKSIADVATAADVDPQTIAGEYLEGLAENLAAAVEDGKITQKQADWLLEQAQERVPDQLNNTWEGPVPGGFRGGGRPGRMWGFPSQSDA
jgi:hypothetical protein